MKTKIIFFLMLFFSIMIYSQITIKDLSISKINNKQKDTENANKVQVDEETIKRKKTVSKYFKHIDSSKDLTPDQAGYLLKAVYHKIDSLYLIKDSINSKAYSNKHSKNLDTVVINLNELSLAKEYLATINSLEGVPKISRKFVPIRSVYQANYFFMNSPNGESKINFVKDLSIIGNLNGLYTLQANILTGVFPLATKYVPVKVSINGNVSQQTNKSENSDNEESNQNPNDVSVNKLASGGLFNAEFTYPLYFSNWKYANENSFTVYAPISYRINIDDISDGIKLKDSYYYHEFSAALLVATDVLQGYKQQENSATLFASLRFSYFKGSDSFEKNLQFNNFWMGQLNAGLKIQKKFIISVLVPIYSSEKDLLSKTYGSIGLTFLSK